METPISVLTTLFILLLIVPGIFFKRFYFSGEFAQQFGVGLFADRLISSIFWGFAVQLVTYLIFSRFFEFNLLDIKDDLAISYTNLAENKLPPGFEKYDLWKILQYLLLSTVVATTLGWFCHLVVRILKLDINVKALRFTNHWNYYFRGEFLLSKTDKDGQREKWLSTYVDIVMDSGNQSSKLFSGFLYDYSISAKTGELESIILTEVKKYCEKEVPKGLRKETFKGFIDIPSDYLVIPYAKVIDINIRYNTRKVKNIIKPILRTTLNTVILLLLLLIIVGPWFLGLSFIRTLFGIFTLFTIWIVLLTILNKWIGIEPRKDAPEPNIISLLILMAIMIGFTINILQINICYSCLWEWLASKFHSNP